MSDEATLADAAGDLSSVATPQDETRADLTQGQEGTEAEAPPPETDEEAKRRETSKERREREKAYKQKLRETAEAAEARASQAEAELARIRQQAQQIPAPSRDQYPTDADYIAARSAWAARQGMAQERVADIEAQLAAARDQVDQVRSVDAQVTEVSWQQRTQEARTRYADFDAVALAPENPITPQMAQILKATDNGPDIAYALGKNRALAAEIAALPVHEAAFALGTLAAAIKPPTPRTATQAPAPTTPLKGASAHASKDPAKMSMAEYEAARRAGKLR